MPGTIIPDEQSPSVETASSVKPSFSKDCFSGEAMDDCSKRLKEEVRSELSQQEFQTEDLPQSCDGIHAVRYDLYPNLDECLDAIVERINFACHVKSGGDRDETLACVSDLTYTLNEQCQGSEDMGLLSVSFEACLWNQYYHVYKKLGDVCVKNEDKMQCLADIKIGK